MNEFAKNLYNRARELIEQGEECSPILVMVTKESGTLCIPVALPVGQLMENNEAKDMLSWLPAYWWLMTNDLESVALIVESRFYSTEILMEKTGCTKKDAESRLKEIQWSNEYPPECYQECLFMRIESGTEQQEMMAIIEPQEDGSILLKDQEICEDAVISGRLTGLLSRAAYLQERYAQFVENTADIQLPEDTSKLALFSMYLSEEEKTTPHANARRLAYDIFKSWIQTLLRKKTHQIIKRQKERRKSWMLRKVHSKSARTYHNLRAHVVKRGNRKLRKATSYVKKRG